MRTASNIPDVFFLPMPANMYLGFARMVYTYHRIWCKKRASSRLKSLELGISKKLTKKGT